MPPVRRVIHHRPPGHAAGLVMRACIESVVNVAFPERSAQPDTPALPQIPADGTGCSSCALPTHSGQRADAAKPIIVAARCLSGKRVMGRCLQ